MPTEAPTEITRSAIDEAFVVAQVEVDHLKSEGMICRVEEITDEDGLDDHFDDLARVFRQTFLERGLPWPPTSIDATENN